MNDRIKGIVFVLLVIFILSNCSAATGIEISSGWTRPTMQVDNGAVYFLLQNHSVGKDELTGVSSEFAEAVEIHESQGKESILFGPGGYHAMLAG